MLHEQRLSVQNGPDVARGGHSPGERGWGLTWRSSSLLDLGVTLLSLLETEGWPCCASGVLSIPWMSLFQGQPALCVLSSWTCPEPAADPTSGQLCAAPSQPGARCAPQNSLGQPKGCWPCSGGAGGHSFVPPQRMPCPGGGSRDGKGDGGEVRVIQEV